MVKNFFLLALSGSAGAAIYVSPAGKDTAAGTEAAPVATAQRALELSVQKNDPLIYFADGVYFSEKPLTIEPQHSGKEKQPRVFKAIHEGKVIFSAGQQVALTWKHNGEGRYTAQVPMSVDLTQGCDGLFIEGQSPRLARFPNYDRSARWLKGSSAEAFSPERIKTWKNPKGGILHAMHPAHWGGNHWTITGKKSETECNLEGGWMNNRGGGIHPKDRFVENIYEELDAPSEWFLDKQTRTLSYIPEGELKTNKTILAKHESCVRILGSADKPVQHISFDGISFRHTARTFMKTKEPLLRSDWRIYRGGAFYLEGAQRITVQNCEFTDLGGNAYFASGHNRELLVKGCHFHQIGAGALNIIGLTSAVHNPMFDPYGRAIPFDQINKKDKGPKTDDYPSNIFTIDCLIHDIGLVEKQVAGLQISAAHKVTARHLSIYDVPRAGINIGENAFGGHLIEHCDVFDTVQESADHGSFNSWGRDRYWHLNYREVDKQFAKNPELPKIDMLERNVIRNSRWRCDHGWDIDLDDGSSWYLIENNLCLGGGIKLREGFYRIARNNLVVSNTLHPHVWFKDCQDEIYSNIWATPYEPIQNVGKGKRWDSNVHLTSAGLKQAQEYGVDRHGLVSKIAFTNPDQLDYSFKETAETKKAGFKPFDLTLFGVQKASLKAIARTPQPAVLRNGGSLSAPILPVAGAKIKDVETLGEVSATGLPNKGGALFRSVPANSFFAKAGIKNNDVIRAVNGVAVKNCSEFLYTWAKESEKAAGKEVKITLWRKQRNNPHSLPAFPGVILHARDAKISDGGARYGADVDYIGSWHGHHSKLKWDIELPPNTQYSAIVDQSHPAGFSNSYGIEGFQSNIEMPVAQTKDWSSFRLVPSNSKLVSKAGAMHTITIAPYRMKHERGAALMNFKALILIPN